ICGKSRCLPRILLPHPPGLHNSSIHVDFREGRFQFAETEMGIRFFTLWGFTVAQLVHLFFLTIMGQFVVNSNEEIFQTIYEAKWYNGSSRMQSLYVLVLRKCLNPPTITGGGLVPLNLDSFVQVGLPFSLKGKNSRHLDISSLSINIQSSIRIVRQILRDRCKEEISVFKIV
ncbi:unnamed protein product, partial [Heterotrigona itama]